MFTVDNFVFVPRARQISVYPKSTYSNGYQPGNPLVEFYQVNITNATFQIPVAGTTLQLEPEYLIAEPTPDVLKKLTTAIADNIEPYVSKGVIGAEKAVGEISFTRKNGMWSMTRGSESVVLNNTKQVPDAGNQYWVAYTSGCPKCASALDFEFVGVETSTLVIPDDVSLSDHLRPFIQVMEDEIRRDHHDSNPVLRMLESLPFLSSAAQDHITGHETKLSTVIAGVGSFFPGKREGETGGVAINNEPVITIFDDYIVVLGEHCCYLENDDDDTDDTYRVSDKLGKIIVARLDELQRIDLTHITPETLSEKLVGTVVYAALSDDYNTIDIDDNIQRQLFSVARSCSLPRKENWWLRVVLNAWFVKGQYPLYLVQALVDRQVNELGVHLSISLEQRAIVRQRLRAVVTSW